MKLEIKLPAVGDRISAIDGPGQFPGDRCGTVINHIHGMFDCYATVSMDSGEIETCHGLSTVGIGWYAQEEAA